MKSPLNIRLLLSLSAIALLAAPAAAVADSAEFPRPASIEPAVRFWTDVFTRWTADQIIFFDGRDLDRIYAIRRLPPSNGTAARERMRERLRADWKKALVADLERLAAPDVDYDGLDGRAYRIFCIWDGSRDADVYRRAAEEVRSQRGIREAFLSGIVRSARYVDDFKEIFKEEGVPERLVFLPHVESAYRWNARSGAGALGMWQFMAGTARKYMVVNDAVDERLDPHTAARAAARYLKRAHEKLGTWPLAIVSYNHGVDGIRNAVQETGTTDIGTIIETYRGPLFGFAGRNFYPEFLVAVELGEQLLADPGDLDLHAPVSFDGFTLPAFVKIQTLCQTFGVGRDELKELNPAIRRNGLRGIRYLPRGFQLKLPRGKGAGAAELFAALPASHRPLEEPPRTYRVRRGDSLGIIAARHKTSVRAIQKLNGIRNPNRLRAGVVLRLPH